VFDRRVWQPQPGNMEVMVELEAKEMREYIRRVIGY
jgi:hypothetical protein